MDAWGLWRFMQEDVGQETQIPDLQGHFHCWAMVQGYSFLAGMLLELVAPVKHEGMSKRDFLSPHH
jgi:hypothetical protein